MPSLNEYISRCSCGGNHFLAVQADPGDEDAFLSLCGDYRASHGIWSRLRTAQQVLRKGHGESWVELVLDHGQAAKFGEVLSSWASDAGKENGNAGDPERKES